MKRGRVSRATAWALTILMVLLALPMSGLNGILEVKASEQEAVYELVPNAAQTISQGSTTNMGDSDYFTINASLKAIVIDANSKTASDATSLSYRMKMAAAGSSTSQNISFTITKQYAQITVYALSSTSSDSTRPWILCDSQGSVVDQNCIDGSKVYAYTYYVNGAGTYYMYSGDSGINIYKIAVTETDTILQLNNPSVTATVSGSSVVLDWDKVPGASSYEIYSSKDNYTAPIKTVDVSYDDLKNSALEEIIDETQSGIYTYAVKAISADGTFAESELGQSDEVTVDASSESVVSLDTSVWSSAKLGTQSDKMTTPSYNSLTNTLTLNTGSNGKMANTGQAGMEIYYTKIKSSDYNFTLRGTFHVTDVEKQDNQSSFGLAVLDSLGNEDTTSDYLNQLDLYAATKSEATGTCIPGIRLYTGNTDTTGQTNASGTCDVTQYFDENATVFNSTNATSLYYNFELVKDSNGYLCNWYDDDWENIEYTIRVYNPEKFLIQDSDYIYLGFFASRIGTVEVTNISYEQHEPTEEEIAAIDKGKWVDYDEVSIKTFNGETTASEDYTYRFTSNVTGTVTITDSLGNTYYSDQEIEDGDTITFNMSDYGYELPLGDTTFTTVVTPYENSADEDGNIAYSDRLLLQDYSPVTFENTVTRQSIGEENGEIYVSTTGTSNGTGTEDSPLDLVTAVSYASAGQTIILEDGTYQLSSVLSIPYSVSGTEDAMITLKAQNTGKAILDGSGISKSSDSVLFIKGDYWHIYGINVCNSSDGTKGIHVSGNNNIVEMCEMYNNGSTGLQISYSGGEPKIWWPSNNTILNCTSYYNCDSKQNDADGFAAKLSVGAGNVFDGCISHNNADDGYDLYAKDKTGYGAIEPVTIQNCLAYSNGILEDGSYSDASANGFKLGGEGLTGKHVLKNCVSWNNGGSGIMSNNGPDCQVYNCISVDNGVFSRVDKTADRNNYQLTPKNGTSYLGTTGYVLENVISFYTDSITDYGTMAVDKFTLIGQDSSEIYTENNYLCTDISTGICSNTNNEQVTADWFETVDYANVAPTRNEDGSIDMHGLFVLTDLAPDGVGAVINATKVASGSDNDDAVSDDTGSDVSDGTSSDVSNDNNSSDNIVSDQVSDDTTDSNAVNGTDCITETTTEAAETISETTADTSTDSGQTENRTVETGDTTSVMLYLGAAGMAVLLIAAILYQDNKKKRYIKKTM